MSKKLSSDLSTLKGLDDFEIWGEDFKHYQEDRFYKGKFVLTDAGKFLAKLVPKERFELSCPFGHYALNVARLPFRHFGMVSRKNVSSLPNTAREKL